ncbi:TRAP-type C4-dicarboxylate transport system permease small subunit [Kushneria sinocarnis]|uniref:TRAP transporter small permease protein n=2 Tax=Kushneria sinocarnis TaxID=595502 RepID=A0A420WW05_9GAMM|nr:TRAP-type C4-dicarboxylate transport system permease small subunit [Kushneria sinocarnis]
MHGVMNDKGAVRQREERLRTLSRWLARGRELFYLLGSAVVVVTTVVIGTTLMAGVIVRYFLSGSLAWGNELPVILFPWLVMGGVVMAAVRQQHLGVDFFVRRLPAGVARAVAALMQLLVIGLMGMLIYQSQSLLMFMQYQSSPVLGWPASWAFYSLPLGAAGVMVIALLELVAVVAGCPAVPNEENES